MPSSTAWVDTEYICRTYHVGRETVRAAVRRGELPAFKVGHRKTRFRLVDVETWVRPVEVVDQ